MDWNSAQVIANARPFQDPEDPSRGRFYNCPSGRACKIINTNPFRACGMGERFNNLDPGSAEGLSASPARVHERQEPWIGYYREPSALVDETVYIRASGNKAFWKAHGLSPITPGGATTPATVASGSSARAKAVNADAPNDATDDTTDIEEVTTSGSFGGDRATSAEINAHAETVVTFSQGRPVFTTA